MPYLRPLPWLPRGGGGLFTLSYLPAEVMRFLSLSTITKGLLVASVALGGLLWVQTCRLGSAEDREARAKADASRAVLEAAGWAEAARASQKELAAKVPALQAQIEALKATKTPILVAGRTVTRAVDFSIPTECPPDSPSGGAVTGGPAASATSPEAPPPSTAVSATVETQVAIAGLPDGTIEWAQRIFLSLRTATWSQGRELVPTKQDIAVAPELVAAWRDYISPHRRLDVFVGGSLGLDGAGVVGSVCGGGRRFGWFASADYVIPEPDRSRVAGGLRLTLKK